MKRVKKKKGVGEFHGGVSRGGAQVPAGVADAPDAAGEAASASAASSNSARRTGVRGNSVMRMRWSRTASSTAPMRAAATAMVAHSPMPLTPSGLSTVGEGWKITSISGTSGAVGSRYSAKVVVSGWALAS